MYFLLIVFSFFGTLYAGEIEEKLAFASKHGLYPHKTLHLPMDAPNDAVIKFLSDPYFLPDWVDDYRKPKKIKSRKRGRFFPIKRILN